MSRTGTTTRCDMEGCKRVRRGASELPRGWVRLSGGRHACVGCKLLRRHDPISWKPALVRCACGVTTTEKDAPGHRARCRRAA